MRKINTGIIGFGLSGKVFHAPFISTLNEFNLSKIFTRNSDSIQYINKTYPQAIVVQTVDEILNDNDIELVIIATPNHLHFEYAKLALEHHKHVIVEKPFTLTVKEAETLIDISKQKQKILTVFQNRRFDSDFKTVKKVIENGKLGKIVEYEAHFDRFRNFLKNSWKEGTTLGSGILYDLGPHLIDQALVLFGLPNAVFADLRIQRECATTTDHFEIILFYEHLKVKLKAGMLVKADLPRYIILGDRGSFVKYGMDVQEKELTLGNLPGSLDWGAEPESIWGELTTEEVERVQSEKGSYQDFFLNVHDTIIHNAPLNVKPEEALNTMKIIESAILSAEEKQVIKFK